MKYYRDKTTFEVLEKPKVYQNQEGHTIERCKTKNGNLFFVTLKDSHYCAHGKTLADAVADAKYKDPSQRPKIDELLFEIKQAGKNRVITLNEFRFITGACRVGCEQALDKVGLSHVSAMSAYDIRDKVSREWGKKLIDMIGWEE